MRIWVAGLIAALTSALPMAAYVDNASASAAAGDQRAIEACVRNIERHAQTNDPAVRLEACTCAVRELRAQGFTASEDDEYALIVSAPEGEIMHFGRLKYFEQWVSQMRTVQSGAGFISGHAPTRTTRVDEPRFPERRRHAMHARSGMMRCIIAPTGYFPAMESGDLFGNEDFHPASTSRQERLARGEEPELVLDSTEAERAATGLGRARLVASRLGYGRLPQLHRGAPRADVPPVNGVQRSWCSGLREAGEFTIGLLVEVDETGYARRQTVLFADPPPSIGVMNPARTPWACAFGRARGYEYTVDGAPVRSTTGIYIDSVRVRIEE